MKNSKKYAANIAKLYKTLARKSEKFVLAQHDDLTDAIVFAVISEYLSTKQAEKALKAFQNHFIDWNDLRVSLAAEIIEVLSSDTKETRLVAANVGYILQAIFAKYDCLIISGLKKAGKREIKETLEKLKSTSPFVVDYCMITVISGHAIPLTANMIEYLKDNDLVDAKSDYHTIEGFLARQISAKDGYKFYCLLRQVSEQAAAKKAIETAKALKLAEKEAKKAAAKTAKPAKKTVKKKSVTKKTVTKKVVKKVTKKTAKKKTVKKKIAKAKTTKKKAVKKTAKKKSVAKKTVKKKATKKK